MADKPDSDYSDLPFDTSPPEDLAAAVRLRRDLTEDNTAQDTAVGLVDTIQSIGTTLLSPLPDVELQDAGANSRYLDQFRSPAYKASQVVQSLDNDPNAGFVDSALESFNDTLRSGNIVADATAQLPYLIAGPAARLTAINRAQKATSIVGKIAQFTLADTNAATINRLAAITGGLEAGGAYGQTYDRALAQTGDENIAAEQAQKAAIVSGIVGAALGRLTPGFELHPTGRGLVGGARAHISAVGGEALVEEGGLAIVQQVTDNVLAGKDPSEGVGTAFGQAVAVSGAFSGVLRSPQVALDLAHDVGRGVRAGLKAAGKNAVTPEDAAVAAADAANQPPGPRPPPTPSPVDVGVAQPLTGQEAANAKEDAFSQVREEDIPTVYPPGDIPAAQPLTGEEAAQRKEDAFSQVREEDIPTIYPPGEDNGRAKTEPEAAPEVRTEPTESVGTGSETGSAVRTEDQPAAAQAPQVKTDSNSPTIKAVLVDAATDQIIENTTGAEQAAALARKEELAPSVRKAKAVVQALPTDYVAKQVEKAAAGNEQSARVVEAVRHVDATKLPESALSKEEKPVVQMLLDLKENKIDRTSKDIFETGFTGAFESFGVNDYLQNILSANAAGIKGKNPGSTELQRFVKHLTNRADAFLGALNEVRTTGKSVEVKGTETRDSNGKLTKKPFIIHNNKASIEVAEQVLKDAARAQQALDVAREAFPQMFEKAAPVVAPVRQAEKSVPQATKTEAKPAPVAPVTQNEVATAPVELSLVEDNAPARVLEDVTSQVSADEVAEPGVIYRNVPESADPYAPNERGFTTWSTSPRIARTYGPKQGKLKFDESTNKHLGTLEDARKELGVSNEGTAQDIAEAAALKYQGQFKSVSYDLPAEVSGTPTEIVVFSTPVRAPMTLTTFEGINRFVQSFIANGKGLLATGYDKIVSTLTDGDAAEQRAAQMLQDNVPLFANAIRNHIQKVLNSPINKSGTLLKDAIDKNPAAYRDYADHLWVNLLTKTADGYALNEDTVTALASASLMQLVRTAFESDVRSDEDSADDAYYKFLNNIAKDSMRILGMDRITSESMTLTDGIPLSLASSMLEALSQMPVGKDTLLDVTSTISEGKTLKTVTVHPDIIKALRNYPGFPDVMRKFFGDADDDTIHYGAPPTEVKNTYRNSRTQITPEQRTAVENRQKVVHKRNVGFLNVLKTLGNSQYTKLITGFAEVDKDPNLEKISGSLVRGLTGELNAVARYNDGVEKYAADNGLNPDDVAVHFAYEILKNGRSFSGYSAQAKKTIREFLTVGKETLDLNNADNVRRLKLAIAQAVGIKTDINNHDQVVADLEKKIPELTAVATALYAASQSGVEDANLAKLMDRDALYTEKEIHGLMVLGKYLANPTQVAFENTLTYEIDGKTNGPFMAELLFGLWRMDKQTDKNLQQGGFFRGVVGATLANMQSWLRGEYASVDLYERVASGAATLQDEILLTAGFVDSTGALTRTAAKEAVTPLVYGSRLNSLSNVFAKRIDTGLADALRIAKRQNNQALVKKINGWIGSGEVVDLGATVAEALEAAYAKEKPQVSVVTKMMVDISSLHAAIRKALLTKERNVLLTAKRKDGLPKQFELSREDYAKILKGIPNTGVNVPGMGTITVGESAVSGRSSVAVNGAGKAHSIQISIPDIENPGVSILANLTIGGGDAAMGNFLFQNGEQVLDVYDGIEMSVSQIDLMGTKLNNAVWKSSSDSLLDGFVPMLDFIQANLKMLDGANIIPFLLDAEILAAYNKGNPAALKKGNDALLEFYKETGLARTLKSVRSTYKTGETSKAVAALRNDLETKARQIKQNRATLNSEQSSLNQMAGGGTYATDSVNTARNEAVTGEFRKGWDKTIEAGFDAANGTLDREGVIALLDGHKWKNKVHRAIWNKLRSIIPADLLVALAKNEEEWYALNAAGNNGLAYGKVNGTSYYSSGVITLATADPVTMLHEMIHQVVTGNISHYFSNINAVPVELRSSINDLTQLLKRFMAIKGFGELSTVQGFIQGKIDEGDTAAAVDEMLAHVLSNEELIKELSPSLFERVAAAFQRILHYFFGKSSEGPFLEEAMKAFNRLAGGFRMDVNDGVRTSPVLDKTAAAFRVVAQKVANGTIKGVPKIRYSGLATILKTYNLSPEQKIIYNRVWMLLRMDSRSGMLEKYASDVLAKHPNASIFNGNIDAVAAVMALTAADDTFRAQADAIWKQSQPPGIDAGGLIDMALHGAALNDGQSLLNEALDTMRAEGEYQLSFLGTATQRLDRMGNEWMETVGETASKAAAQAPQGVDHLLHGIHALTTEVGAAAFGKTLIALANQFTEARWLQDLMAALVGSQADTNAVYRQVNTMKSTIAQTRSMFTITLPAQLKKLFPEGFDGWNHLFTHFGRVDAGVLGASASQMYQDNLARNRAIKALESKVVNNLDAKNLAHYLVNGTVVPGSPLALLRNARAIADNLNGTKQKASDSLVQDVDQLVTLYAIEMLKPADRSRIAGYFTSHPEAMNNLTGMMQKIAAEEVKQYDDAYRYAYWKGALPLSTDPRTSIVVAGAVKGAELVKLGYTRKQKFRNAPNDPQTDLHYYHRDSAPPPAFTQGIINTVQQTSQGVNYVTGSTITPEVGTVIGKPRLVQYITQNQGTDSNLVPIFNFDGDITGYERLLDRKIVQSMTNSNNTLLHIAMGAKLGRILEERLADKFNRTAVGVLVNQWKLGVQNGEQDQYEDVSNSTDKQVVRAWEVVPAATKKMLEAEFGGPVMIRKDLVANTLGYHKAGVGDIFTGDASMSPETRRGLIGLAQTIMGPNTAKILFIAESAIKEGVATAKDWIIVRSLSVAISNAMASLNLVIGNGVPIKEVFASYREGLADVRTYARLQKEIINLTVQISGATPTEAEKLRTIQDGKRQSIRRLAIYPLIEAGELSDLPEGLEETPQHSYLGDFSGWLNNHLRVIHPKAPDVLANAFIAKDTAFHDAVSKAIQAGDFLGKWAVYKHMVKSGKSVEVARDTVRDEFISYGTNPGRFRGALEDFGIVWWSQFTLRAQKVLLRRFRRNPFSFFLAGQIGSVLGTDAPGDAALPERHWDSGTGLDNVLNAPSAHIWSKIF